MAISSSLWAWQHAKHTASVLGLLGIAEALCDVRGDRQRLAILDAVLGELTIHSVLGGGVSKQAGLKHGPPREGSKQAGLGLPPALSYK